MFYLQRCPIFSGVPINNLSGTTIIFIMGTYVCVYDFLLIFVQGEVDVVDFTPKEQVIVEAEVEAEVNERESETKNEIKAHVPANKNEDKKLKKKEKEKKEKERKEKKQKDKKGTSHTLKTQS